MKQKRFLSVLIATVLSVTGIGQSAGVVAAAAEKNVSAAEAVPEMSATGKTQVGMMLADELNQEVARLQSAKTYNVYSIDMDGNEATVHLSAEKDCRLLLGLYTERYEDESDVLLKVLTADVKAGQESVVLTFPADEMPEYFVLRAYLINSEEKPLSMVYVDESYTKDIQMLKESDISCYEGYDVLNLDDQDYTNFAVYKQDVIVLKSSDTENIVAAEDDKKGTYTIRNLSEKLAKNNLVSIETSEGVKIFRVKSLSTSGNETIVQTDPETKPDEAFAYIKVELTPSDCSGEFQTAEKAQPVKKPQPLFGEDSRWSGSATVDLSPGADDNELSPIAESDASLNDLTLIADLHWAVSFDHYSTETHTQSSLYIETQVDLELELEAHSQVDIPIGTVFTMPKTLGLELNLGFYLRLGLDGTVKGTATISSVYDSNGFHTDTDCKLSVGVSFFAGIVLKATGFFINRFTVNAEFFCGFRATLEMAPAHSGCDKCFQGDISVEASYEVKLRVHFLFIDWDAGSSGTLQFKLTDIYYNKHDGLQFGKCPNIGASAAVEALKIDPETGEPKDPEDIPADGLTDEQREYLVFRKITDNSDGFSVYSGNSSQLERYAVSVNPAHVEDITSIEIPAAYCGKPVTMVGGTSGVSHSYIGDECTYDVEWSDAGRNDQAGFEGCVNLKSVKLPDTIKTIGDFAFAGCTALETINLPDTLLLVRKFAFFGANKMALVSLPSQLREIGAYAFVDCDSAFSELTIPCTVKQMGYEVFGGCDGIKSVTTNTAEIPQACFSRCRNIQHVFIGEPAVIIRLWAFQDCSSLTSVFLPDTLRIIGGSTFSGCKSLHHIDLPVNLYEIQSLAFQSDPLQKFIIPPQIKDLAAYVLEGNNVIKSVTVPKNVQTIDFSAFRYTSKMESVIILNPTAVFAELDSEVASEIDAYYDRERKTIYGYSGSTTEEFCKKYGFKFVPLDPKKPSTEHTDPVQTGRSPVQVTITGLIPNTVYNFYDLLTEEFLAENLLYLSQGVTDETGALELWYRPTQDNTHSHKIVKCNTRRWGDINLDDSVDVADAVLLSRYIVEDSEAVIYTEGKVNADVNHDDYITTDDCIMILQYIARIIKEL